METLMHILKEIDEEINWEEEKRLIDERILDSLAVITLITEIEDAFQIEIRAEEITQDNFNSAEAIWSMICPSADEVVYPAAFRICVYLDLQREDGTLAGGDISVYALYLPVDLLCPREAAICL